MRTIKFRAWNNKKMVSFNLGNIYGYEGEVCGIILPDSETILNNESGYDRNEDGSLNPDLKIMQYTGLKDVDGKPIYEGDIAKADNGAIGTIVFSSGAFCWTDGASNWWLMCDDDNQPEDDGMLKCEDTEVIGNIYENPELLEA